MCGIFGALSKTEEIIIEKNLLPHRGPDDWGVFYDEPPNCFLTLFQSRLSIIGLGAQGHQPYKKYNDYVLVFNGEIYNFKEIKEKLIKEFGINFTTSTDTEVLYESLIHLGLNITLALCNGLFAFGFYDKKKQTLCIARDHLGIKPLYYIHSSNIFSFTSEIKTFFELDIIKPLIRKDLLGEYFANGWIYEPDTLFQNIYKLKAGHFAVFNFNNNDLDIKKYWDIDDKNGIHYTVEEIVKRQTVADVSFGIYLSGGIDSSLVELALKNNHTFNLNISLSDGESERVSLLERLYNLEVFKIQGIDQSLNLYDKLIYYLDEPIADAAIIPAYELARISRENGKIVMLSGMGGDEIDGGYSRHLIIKNLLFVKLLRFLPLSLLLVKGKIKRNIFRLKAFAKEPKPENYFALTSYLTKTEINKLTDNKWFPNYSKKINDMCKTVQGNKKYFYLDFKGFLASHNLIYMDKASMAASVEVRVPLLDKNLASSFFPNINTSARFKLKPRLKRMLEDKLGKNYKNTKKEGFRYPYYEWLRSEINWDEIFIFFESLQLINTQIVKIWVKEIENDIDSVGMKLLYVYTLYRWMKIFNVKT